MKLTRLLPAVALGVLAVAAQDLSTEELRKLVENEKNLFFLDVREPKELQELGTLKGYVNIPLGQLESRLSEVPRDKVIVTA
jgi:rhodanese-related sulfurtransferase